jgi:hypothetical protein
MVAESSGGDEERMDRILELAGQERSDDQKRTGNVHLDITIALRFA